MHVGQVSFDASTGKRKLAQVNGLGGKQLAAEDQGGELPPSLNTVQPGYSRLANRVQGRLFMEDQAGGHRAEGPGWQPVPRLPDLPCQTFHAPWRRDLLLCTGLTP